jgi:alpha-L-fucosidase
LGEVDSDEQWFCNNPYAEWYYNSVNVGRGPTYEHHMNTYGREFRYEDFIPILEAFYGSRPLHRDF